MSRMGAVDIRSRAAQAKLFELCGVVIEKADDAELVLRHRDGSRERLVAVPGLAYEDVDFVRDDGIWRDGRFYRFGGTSRVES